MNELEKLGQELEREFCAIFGITPCLKESAEIQALIKTTLEEVVREAVRVCAGLRDAYGNLPLESDECKSQACDECADAILSNFGLSEEK